VSAITRKKLISKDVKSTPQEKESSYLLTVLLLLLVLPLLIVFPEVIFPLPPVMFLDTPARTADIVTLCFYVLYRANSKHRYSEDGTDDGCV
jgi:hypothetical protein